MNLKKLINHILFIFMIIYPIFDLKIFYNSFTTILRIITILIIFILVLIYEKKARENIKWLILFLFLVIIYTIFHHYNALNFKSVVPGNFNYSLFKELLQILKISTPTIFLYTCFHFKFETKKYIQIIRIWLIFICGLIITTNLLKISLGSYSDTYILGSIFNWFDTSLTYYDLASKGYFMYANQISALLVILLPIVFYLHIKKEIKFIYIISLMITLLMLGTRVANIGGVLVLFGILSIYLFFTIIKRERLNYKLIISNLILIILYCLILPFSPTISRDKIYEYILEPKFELVYDGNIGFDKLRYIENNYEDKKIYEHFILNSYPYQNDPDFWLDILDKDESLRTNYRYLEIEMVKRVVSINSNKYDLFLGITNTRIQNIFNIERDYILQYYAYGIFGLIIFMFCYLFILIFTIIKLFKSFSLKNSIFISITLLFLLISYLSGNILNQLNIPVVYIFLNIMYNEEEKV